MAMLNFWRVKSLCQAPTRACSAQQRGAGGADLHEASARRAVAKNVVEQGLGWEPYGKHMGTICFFFPQFVYMIYTYYTYS